MKGPCGSDGGRRRYDAASPEPMYRVEADGFAARPVPPSTCIIEHADPLASSALEKVSGVRIPICLVPFG